MALLWGRAEVPIVLGLGASAAAPAHTPARRLTASAQAAANGQLHRVGHGRCGCVRVFKAPALKLPMVGKCTAYLFLLAGVELYRILPNLRSADKARGN